MHAGPLSALLHTNVDATSARCLDASQTAMTCLDRSSGAVWVAEGSRKAICTTVMPSIPHGLKTPLMTHIDGNHRHRRQGDRHTATLHKVPQSEQLLGTLMVVSWKWRGEQLPWDWGDRIKKWTNPCYCEEPIPECENQPRGAKVTTLYSHLFQRATLLSLNTF